MSFSQEPGIEGFDTKGTCLLLDARWSQRLVSILIAIDSSILGMLISMEALKRSCFPSIINAFVTSISEFVKAYLVMLKSYCYIGTGQSH